MKQPKCNSCEHMMILGRARQNGNNRGLKGPRAKCFCEHPKANETFQRMFPRSPRMVGFIGFTPPGESCPACKTAPKWCPKRQEGFVHE